MSTYGLAFADFPHHAEMLAASGITADHARARGYRPIDTKKRLEELRVTKAGRNVPGLLIPQLRKDGSTWGFQYRPDEPRSDAKGRPVKYETPTGQRNGIDVPPGVGPQLDDPAVPLWITEGVKKADAAALAGLCCVALPGVWSWRGSNSHGGKVAVADWHDIALNDRRAVLAFDSDVVRKRAVRRALDELAGYLSTKGAKVEFLHLPDDDADKCGLDDYLVDGHDVGDLWRLVRPNAPAVVDPPPPPPPPSAQQQPSATPVGLADALDTFHRWLHLDTDDAILVVAATVVGNLAPGDPCWLLVVAAPSSAKTEIVRSVESLPYVHMASTVTEAALLSGTSLKERAKDATGGLLRQVGSFGILCFKDFTSTLSQNKDVAKQALSALREIYDGAWHRPVGSDGGRVLRWSGKCGLVGAVTPSIDKYVQVVSALGDRYLMLRLDSVDDPEKVVNAALWHDSNPATMRHELADAMTGLIASADMAKVTREPDVEERSALGRLAIYTARARTVVERDGYTGDLLVMPQPEGPARLALAFKRIYGGLEALGVDADQRWRILARVAIDCVPSVRTALLAYLVTLKMPARTDAIAEAVGMVKRTAERNLEDLALIEMVDRSRDGNTTNAAIQWQPAAWLRRHHPSATEKYPPSPNPSVKRGETRSRTAETDADTRHSTPPRTSLSRSEQPVEPQPGDQADSRDLDRATQLVIDILGATEIEDETP